MRALNGRGRLKVETHSELDGTVEHKHYIDKHYEDLPELRNWKWSEPSSNIAPTSDSVGSGSRRKLMAKIKHSHNTHVDPDSDSVHHRFHRPYWKHAHYDWRLWVAVCLMLVAMLTYVMSDDLAWRPRSQPQQPPAGVVAK